MVLQWRSQHVFPRTPWPTCRMPCIQTGHAASHSSVPLLDGKRFKRVSVMTPLWGGLSIPIPLAPGLCKSICSWWFALPSSSAPLAAPSAPDHRSAKLGGTQWPQARSEWSQGSGENETGAEPLRNSRRPASRRPWREGTELPQGPRNFGNWVVSLSKKHPVGRNTFILIKPKSKMSYSCG